MNNFNVNITIEDLICSNCCKDREIKTETITSSSEVINLKEGYILNVVSINSSYFTIIVQNGINTIIRNVFTSFPIRIYLPCKCANHILTISGNIVEIVK